MLVKYALFGLGFLLALAVAGIDLSRFTLIAGALGVGIGFGLQNVVNNFISGLILAFERPIHIGDVIEVGSLTGTAQRIGIRSSSIRTFDGAEVIVPNGDLISAQVVNWTLSDNMRRIEISIGVAYGTEPKQVLDILTQVAREHPDVLGQPEPIALFREFGDSSLNFTLRFWTSQFDKWVQIRSEVAVALNQALKEAGIQIPFPQRDLHLRSIDSSLKLPAAEAGSKAAP
jgi:small-conductance mechanosensitive channel